jgi:hypothetical protein
MLRHRGRRGRQQPGQRATLRLDGRVDQGLLERLLGEADPLERLGGCGADVGRRDAAVIRTSGCKRARSRGNRRRAASTATMATATS